MSAPATADVQLANLKLHVTHLLHAIDRGYFGGGVGLKDSAFVAPLRAYVSKRAS